jgi:hypothetical protein
LVRVGSPRGIFQGAVVRSAGLSRDFPWQRVHSPSSSKHVLLVTVTKQTGTMLMAITGQKDFSNKKQKQNNTKENEHRVLSTD